MTFLALTPGACPAGDEIHEGDEIYHDGVSYRHVRCQEHIADLQRTEREKDSAHAAQ